MYIESVPNRGSPPAILLRESFRADGRVRKRTLANLSTWPTALVEGFRTLLKGGVAVAADAIGIRRLCRTHHSLCQPNHTHPRATAESHRSPRTHGSKGRFHWLKLTVTNGASITSND